MGVEDFAKYVIDNISRATLSNALNISNKLNGGEYYNLDEFIVAIDKYVSSQLVNNKISKAAAYKILDSSCTLIKKLETTFKYNKQMLADDYIIDIWRAINGY